LFRVGHAEGVTNYLFLF